MKRKRGLTLVEVLVCVAVVVVLCVAVIVLSGARRPRETHTPRCPDNLRWLARAMATYVN